MDDEVLTAPLVLEYPYSRTIGPTISRFLTGLRDGRIEGVRGSDGRVHVPPPDYDPITAEDLTEFVPLAETGEVVSWSWCEVPVEGAPLERPFAWALVRLDGADTSMLHAVDAEESTMATGMRVRARWRDEREGHIRDIECFEPATGA